MQPPIPPPTPDAPQSCPQCGALIVGRLPFCPHCGQSLGNGGGSRYVSGTSAPAEVGCLKVLGVSILCMVAFLAGLIGTCMGVSGAHAGAGHGVDMSMLGTALVCFVLTTACVAGVVALLRKP